LAAYATDSYLGRVTDPETNATTTCNFITQFATLEGDDLPDISAMYKEDGMVVADSVVMNLFIKSYYGDSINSMKLGVYELDSANVIPEGEKLYTNIDPEDYVSTNPLALKKETSFAVTDFDISDTVRFASSSTRNIRIQLPASYGTRILRLFYEHPEYFSNNYAFIHHVMPGFYFKILGGNGTMVNIDITMLTIFFRFNTNGKTYVGLKRVAATREVIQCNYFENRNLQPLMDAEDYTFVKSPVAIFTELEMPIDSIFYNHRNDSINSAKLVLPRYNNEQAAGSTYVLPPPGKLLMVPKEQLHQFFEQRKVPDNRTSFTTEFSAANNSYTFSNIANLVSYLNRLRNKGAGVSNSDSESTRRAKIEAWEAKHPDWNKMVLLPVTTNSNSSGNIIDVANDLSMASVKLVGGLDRKLQISVVYSSFSE
ncbi:MAG: DUF4270 domain-containing protein, partial [Bacteroidaceae bacterium]|nr:DUF4270 domain-containing protein [Bacteroidaceae bacterium]